MNFASPIFLFAFLPLVLIAYHLLRPIRAKNVLLIAAGLVFYAFGDLRHLPLLLASCALHYGVGLALMRARRGRRLLLAACVTVDLAVLAAYKWHGALPLGISFFTLQAVSYLVDVYREKVKADDCLPRLALWLAFFPQITEGPICRYSQTAEQLWSVGRIDFSNLTLGLERLLYGMMKKIVVADRLNPLIKEVFDNYNMYDGGVIALAAVCYTIQLYMDFSGAMDAVTGIAQMLGVTMPENFRRPFFSKTISEFWKRWHITLGEWLKDYLFYPVTMSKPMQHLTKAARGSAINTARCSQAASRCSAYGSSTVFGTGLRGTTFSSASITSS